MVPLILLINVLTWSLAIGQDTCDGTNSVFPCDAGQDTCMRRKYGKDQYVCVCDSSYCDDLGPLPDTSDGKVAVYETTRDGLRFRKNYVYKGQSSLTEPTVKTKKKFTIKVKRDEKHQSIWGFGGAFTDSTGINLRYLNDTLAAHVINDYYSPQGIGYSVGRVPVGGTDFSDRPYTYNDDNVGDYEQTNFTLAQDDHLYKIPYIKQAQKLNGNLKLLASAWSPPAWMKSSNSISKRGTLKSSDVYYKSWAKYYAKFFTEYKKKGIEFWGLTSGNEPVASYIHSSFNGLTFTPGSLRDFIRDSLAPELAKAGFPLQDKLKLLVLDDQLAVVLAWLGKVYGDEATHSLVSGIAFHWYLNFMTPNFVYSLIHKWYPDQLLISTEACEGYRMILDPHKVILGDWGRGENYASDILNDLNHGVHGWVDWNMALDPSGGPNWADNKVDSPIIVNKTANEYYRQPMFYSLAHIAKFLPPNSVRLGSKGSHGGVDYTVFQTPDNNIAVIILNKSKDTINLTVAAAYGKDVTWQIKPKSLTTIYGKAS